MCCELHLNTASVLLLRIRESDISSVYSALHDESPKTACANHLRRILLLLASVSPFTPPLLQLALPPVFKQRVEQEKIMRREAASLYSRSYIIRVSLECMGTPGSCCCEHMRTLDASASRTLKVLLTVVKWHMRNAAAKHTLCSCGPHTHAREICSTHKVGWQYSGEPMDN